MKVIKPFNYFGSKFHMYKQIHKYFPNKYSIYLEPYCGSGVVGLNQNNIPPVEFYNDLDKNVYSFLKCLSDNDLFTQLKDKLDILVLHEDIFNECRESIKKDILIADRAYCFFILNMCSFDNNLENWRIRRNIKNGQCVTVSSIFNKIDSLDLFYKRLSHAVFFNMDAIDFMQRNDKKETFIYADPPYVQ